MKKITKTSKTMAQFPVGTRVGKIDQEDSRQADYGFIESHSSKKPNTVKVQFDQESWVSKAKYPPVIKYCSINSLELEADAKRMTSQMEQEFEAMNKEIEVKLGQAALMIKEAQIIAKSKGFVLQDCYEGTNGLMSALDTAGWQTSSLSC